MTEDEAIDHAKRELSQETVVRSSKATYVGNVSGEWLVTFEKADGSLVHYRVHSNGTTSPAGLVINATPSIDSGAGCRSILGLICFSFGLVVCIGAKFLAGSWW